MIFFIKMVFNKIKSSFDNNSSKNFLTFLTLKKIYLENIRNIINTF